LAIQKHRSKGLFWLYKAKQKKAIFGHHLPNFYKPIRQKMLNFAQQSLTNWAFQLAMTPVSAFVLSYIKFQDHHAILKVYSLEHGFDTYFMSNIYNKKNKLKPLLAPLNQVKIMAQDQQKGNLKTVKSMALNQNYSIASNLYNNSILLFMADMLGQILSKEGGNSTIYKHLQAFVLSLAHQNTQAHVHLLIKLTQALGIAPLLSAGWHLNVETALYDAVPSSALHLSQELSALWKQIVANDWPFDTLPNFKNAEAMKSIFAYYQYHYPNFREPEAYQIIKEMFE
jgi:DNA repair protein RecO (recombination protein O)